MPELPEVETIVRGLEPLLKGARISFLRILDPSLLRRTEASGLAVFAGKGILGVRRRGKMVLVDCEGGVGLVFHLKMTGRLLLVPPHVAPDKHTRLVVGLEGLKAELRFRDVRRFGFLAASGPPPRPPLPELTDLGPEPFALDFVSFRDLFALRKGRIKSRLLDQGVIAGIGNIYADEILHKARLHPLASVRDLSDDDLRALWKAMRAVLKEAIIQKGSSIRDYTDAEGRGGGFQRRHQVYGREGKKCPGCSATIRRIKIGGRSAAFCPSCQKLPGR